MHIIYIKNDFRIIKKITMEYIKYDIEDDIKNIIKPLEKFKSQDFSFNVKLTGSMTRGTNIETSDIDINIILNTNITNKSLFPENNELLRHTNKEYLITDNEKKDFDFKSFIKKYFNFRNELLQYIIDFTDFEIRNEKKVFKIIYNKQEYDIAICIDYHFYAKENVYNGTCLIHKINNRLQLNFLDFMAHKIVEKNKNTNGNFIEIIKVFKTIKKKNKLSISSYSLENLMYQVPDNYFNDKKLENIKNVSKYLINIINERYENLLTIDGIMYLNYSLDKYKVLFLLRAIIKLNITSKL